eukprot:TRINITY_DN25439_c0_g1_i1.p1 TRINITY_DN25439_c0_g1~~TRINITY_DN25439_c0_g1_i1.p1  ORF type:complete len:791 (+),score=117.25 TRINITY_DN25439_c0_g1_i1:49-2421(+)
MGHGRCLCRRCNHGHGRRLLCKLRVSGRRLWSCIPIRRPLVDLRFLLPAVMALSPPAPSVAAANPSHRGSPESPVSVSSGDIFVGRVLRRRSLGSSAVPFRIRRPRAERLPSHAGIRDGARQRSHRSSLSPHSAAANGGDGHGGQPFAALFQVAAPGQELVATGVRLRPTLPHDAIVPREEVPGGSCVTIEPPRRVVVIDPQRLQGRVFECDFAFDSSNPCSTHYTDQQTIYDNIGAPMVDHALNGFNCCLCAYGQTGTGKTHTIVGDWSSVQQKGLVPRLTEGIFAKLESMCADGSVEANVQVSCVEIYKDHLRDLFISESVSECGVGGLALTSAHNGGVGSRRASVASVVTRVQRRSRLKIHTHPSRGVYVKNLSETQVKSAEEVAHLVTICERIRHTATTSMNSRSSRSHVIFTTRLELHSAIDDLTRVATIKVVDLAGRENEQTSECAGQRFQELTYINRSLFQLANCVKALADRTSEFVPFRNSKLTMLLSDSFQRNSRTCMLGTLTQGVSSHEESLLTCRFLESAGRIATQPLANCFPVENLGRPGRLQAEIEAARRRLGLPAVEPSSGIAPVCEDSDEDEDSDGDVVEAAPQQEQKIEEQAQKGEAEKEEEIRLKCQRVASSLCDVAAAMNRVDRANSIAAASLDDAEYRLEAMEAAVQAALPAERFGGGGGSVHGRRPHEAHGDQAPSSLSEAFSPLVSQQQPPQQHRLDRLRPPAVAIKIATHESLPALTSPVLRSPASSRRNNVRGGGGGGDAMRAADGRSCGAPSVTVDVSLPPIVMLS